MMHEWEGNDVKLVRELVHGTRQLSHGGVKARAFEERGQHQGKHRPLGLVQNVKNVM